MHLFVRAFLVVWFSGVIGIGGLLFLAALASLFGGFKEFHGNPLIGIFIAPAMLVVGWGLVRVGRRFSAPEEKLVLAYLRDQLLAHQPSERPAA